MGKKKKPVTIDSFSRRLSWLKKESMKTVVIPKGMEEAGFIVDEDLLQDGILSIKWVDPKNRKSSA